MSEAVQVEAAGRHIRIAVENADGDSCKHFVQGGPVELWLTAYDSAAEGSKMVVLTLTLPNYPIGRRHAERLELLTAALTAAIEDAQIDGAAEIPTLDDGHRHVVRFARYRRALPWVAMCEVCMQELVPDVAKWAADRGLLGPGGESFRLNERHGSVKAAIEQAVNRDGGLSG
jgi:hypothetical protein